MEGLLPAVDRGARVLVGHVRVEGATRSVRSAEAADASQWGTEVAARWRLFYLRADDAGVRHLGPGWRRHPSRYRLQGRACEPEAGAKKFTDCEKEEICAKCSEINKRAKAKVPKRRDESYAEAREEGDKKCSQLKGFARRGSENHEKLGGFKHLSPDCEEELQVNGGTRVRRSAWRIRTARG